MYDDNQGITGIITFLGAQPRICNETMAKGISYRSGISAFRWSLIHGTYMARLGTSACNINEVRQNLAVCPYCLKISFWFLLSIVFYLVFPWNLNLRAFLKIPPGRVNLNFLAWKGDLQGKRRVLNDAQLTGQKVGISTSLLSLSLSLPLSL